MKGSRTTKADQQVPVQEDLLPGKGQLKTDRDLQLAQGLAGFDKLLHELENDIRNAKTKKKDDTR